MWSVGVITFALLGGYLPFASADMTSYRKSTKDSPYFDPACFDSVSVEAKDLIRKMLCVDADVRYTATQALAHPWVCVCRCVVA